jgi:hypothetical protein
MHVFVVDGDNDDARSLLSSTVTCMDVKVPVCQSIRDEKPPILKNLYASLAESEKHIMLNSETI